MLKQKLLRKLKVAAGMVCLFGVTTANADLVANWTLDDGSGVMPSEEVSGQNGSVVSSWIAGPAGNGTALEFDGLNDFVDTPFLGETGADARLISAWVRTPQANGGGIIGYGASTTGQKWHLRVNGNGGLRTEVEGGFRFGTTNIADNQWHHIVSVLPAGATNVNQVVHYIDGVRDGVGGTGARVVNTSSTAELVDIGRRIQGANPNPFRGAIDDVRFYGSADVPADGAALDAFAQSLFNNSSPGASPTAHWDFNEGSGTVVGDVSGNGNAGTLTNMAGENPIWSTDAPPAPSGVTGSLQFDASTTGYIQTTAPGILGSDDRTVSFWVKTTDQTDHGLVSWGDSFTNGGKFHVRLNSSGANGAVGAIRTEIQGAYLVGTRVINDGEWHHVSVTFANDGTPEMGDVVMYIDGRREVISGLNNNVVNAPLITQSTGDPSETVAIGGRLQTGVKRQFTGNLADVRIYNESLGMGAVMAEAGVVGTNPLATLSYDASNDASDNNVWEDEIGVIAPGNLDMHFVNANAPAATTTNIVEIGAAYQFDGTNTADMSGIGSLNGFSNSFPGNPTDQDATFEMMFRASDLQGQEILFETGGNGDGSSLTLNNELLQFGAKDGNFDALAVSDLSDIDTSEFVHVMGVIDMTNDTIELFVNGVSAGVVAANGDLVNWAGTDGAALGGQNGTTIGASGSSLLGVMEGVYGNFTGEMALFRYYGHALSSEDVSGIYDSFTVIPEPTSFALLGLVLVGMGRRRATC